MYRTAQKKHKKTEEFLHAKTIVLFYSIFMALHLIYKSINICYEYHKE